MKKVKAFIERGNDGGYSVYVDLDDDSLNYGIHGNGSTAQEAKEDFLSAYQAMKAFCREKGERFVEAGFEFQYDVPSFLAYYGNILSLSGLERLTGVNQGRLSHYLTGRKKPRAKTARKIETKLHEFGRELSEVQLAQ